MVQIKQVWYHFTDRVNWAHSLWPARVGNREQQKIQE